MMRDANTIERAVTRRSIVRTRLIHRGPGFKQSRQRTAAFATDLKYPVVVTVQPPSES